MRSGRRRNVSAVLTKGNDMAEEHRKELTEFGEAALRWSVCAEAAATGDRAEEEADALRDAARYAALRYPPIAEAASKGTDEDEDRAWDQALLDYLELVVRQAVSRGAGAVAVVVTAVVILRLWAGSLSEENLGVAVLSMHWWGTPAVVAGGVVWGMRRFRIDGERWKTMFVAPRDARERLWQFLRDVKFCMFASRFSLAALSFGIGLHVDLFPDLAPAHTTERMTNTLIGTVGAWCIPWGRLWRAITRRSAPRA